MSVANELYSKFNIKKKSSIQMFQLEEWMERYEKHMCFVVRKKRNLLNGKRDD